MTIIIIIACDNKKIIIGIAGGPHLFPPTLYFWDAPRGAARAAQESLGVDQPTAGRHTTPGLPAQGGAGGFFGMPPRGAARAAQESLGVDKPTVGRHATPRLPAQGGAGGIFGMPPRGAARAAQEALGWISRPQGGITTPRIPAQGGAGGIFRCWFSERVPPLQASERSERVSLKLN